jgi:hypothetical protein
MVDEMMEQVVALAVISQPDEISSGLRLRGAVEQYSLPLVLHASFEDPFLLSHEELDALTKDTLSGDKFGLGYPERCGCPHTEEIALSITVLL